MANHASTRTTQLYERRSDEVTLDEVERVGIGYRDDGPIAREICQNWLFSPEQ